jgi:hypothetical protein
MKRTEGKDKALAMHRKLYALIGIAVALSILAAS